MKNRLMTDEERRCWYPELLAKMDKAVSCRQIEGSGETRNCSMQRRSEVK